MAGIYIHIPFCKQACHYCDFHFSTDTGIRKEMTGAIVKEIFLRKAYLGGEPVHTIYFGGGTPSLLALEELNNILSVIRSSFKVSDSAEITLEANPDDLTTEKLNEIKALGVNRLSIGIQSFDDAVLRYLNRAHDGASSRKSFDRARAAGFNNISIDLIYAIPETDHTSWRRNIDQAVLLDPEHISSYSLTIEPKTVFGHRLKKGELNPPDDDLAATQLEMLVNTLVASGYDQYEVSNFGKPGYYSQHNSSYWRQEKYLGAGPSAHSFDGSSRQFNVSNNYQYLRSITASVIPAEREVLSREDRINDYLLTTLRTNWGCDLTFLKKEYDYDLLASHHGYIRQLVGNKYALVENNFFKLTARGKLLADRISSDLFLIRD